MSILNLMPLFIVFSAIVMLFCLRFFLVLHPLNTLKMAFKALLFSKAKSTLALALAGTLGVGNIIGVAVGIGIGGAGCVFWIAFSALFSSVLKFSESALSRDTDRLGGGMLSVIVKTFKAFGKAISRIYAILCLGLALVMGGALQASSASECIGKVFGGAQYHFFLGVFVFLVLIAISNGGRFIERIMSFVIPISVLAYVALSIAVIVLNHQRIPDAVSSIFTSAFSVRSAGGGLFSFLSITTIREGFFRGLLSNEAGAGTSSLAHSDNDRDSVVTAGLLGICEVVFDTLILCTLTGLAVLVGAPDYSSYNSGIEIILNAFGRSLGNVSVIVLTVIISAFAFSTVVCWFYYGLKCFAFLFGTGYQAIYKSVYIVAVIFGLLGNVNFFIEVSDYLLFALCLISTVTVMKNSDRLRNLSEKEGLIPNRRQFPGRLPWTPRRYN